MWTIVVMWTIVRDSCPAIIGGDENHFASS
jgi:hypothetical protein